MGDYQVFEIGWLTHVLTWSFTSALISAICMSAVVDKLERPLARNMPIWLRWVMVPIASFVLGVLAEVVAKLVIALYEISLNHSLTYGPGVSAFVYVAFAPMIFVWAGVVMAPTYKFHCGLVLSFFKIVVAILNVFTILRASSRGVLWPQCDPIMHSPMWWNISAELIGILFLLIVMIGCGAEIVTARRRTAGFPDRALA